MEHLNQPSDFEDFVFGLPIEQIGNEQSSDDSDFFASELPEVGIRYEYFFFLEEEELFDELFILEVDGVFLLEDFADGRGRGGGLGFVYHFILTLN